MHRITGCIVTVPKSIIGAEICVPPTTGVLGNRGKGGIYFRDAGEQRPNFKGKGGTKTRLYLCSPFPTGEQGNGYPLSECWLKGQIWFHSGEQRRLWRVCTFESRLCRVCTIEPTSVNQTLRCWLKCRFYTFLCEQRKLWRNSTFASSSLSHPSSKSRAGSNGDFILFLCLQRKLWRVCIFAQAYLAFVTVAKYHVLPQMAIRVLFTPAA